jgi:hypothetical protein
MELFVETHVRSEDVEKECNNLWIAELKNSW